MRYDPARHRNLRPATDNHASSGRVEVAIDIVTGKQVFILDRKEVLSNEDGFAISTNRVKLPSAISNIRR